MMKRIFLQRHLEGRKIVEIAEEVGRRRKTVSKSYKKKALKMAAEYFIRFVYLMVDSMLGN